MTSMTKILQLVIAVSSISFSESAKFELNTPQSASVFEDDDSGKKAFGVFKLY